jgi:hypothetical protein
LCYYTYTDYINGGKYVNCTFKNIEATDTLYSPIVVIDTNGVSFNVTTCIFTNVTYPDGLGGFCYIMDSEYNGKYNFSGNSLVNFTGLFAALYFEMDFTAFTFLNNSFTNITSENEGGVYLNNFFLIFF